MSRLDSRIINDILHRAHKHVSQALRNVWGKLKIHGTLEGTSELILKDLGAHADTPLSGKGAIYVNGDTPYFKTDGGVATSMIAGGGSTSPGGSDTQVQYNDGGSFGGVASLTFNDSDGHLTVIDDKKLQFGTNADASIEYDEDGNNVLAIDGAATKFTVAGVEIENGSTTGAAALTIDNDDTDQRAFLIDAANIDVDVIDIGADFVTTAFVMDVTAGALTTGGILNLVSNSQDTNVRSLVNIINDNSSSTNVTCLTVRNDGTMATTAPTALIHDVGNMSGDAHATLELRYQGTSGGRQAMLEFNQATGNSSDDDDIGLITATGLNSADEKTTYCDIGFDISDRSDGDEGGEIIFRVMAGGTAGTAAMSELFTIGGEDVANTVVPAVVVNEAGTKCNFRVESDGGTHMLFIEASTNRVSIGNTVDSPGAVLEVVAASNSGVPTFLVENADTDQIAVQITAANIDASALVIAADTITTAHAINISADALTTGTILNLVSDSAQTDTRNLVNIHNDNTGATSTRLIDLTNDAANTTADFRITTALTTGNSIGVIANSLTTGAMLNLTSNSESTGNRTLVTVKNDNTAATGVQMVHFTNDAIGGAGDPILLVESTAEETEALIELRNSNAAHDKQPILKFNRTSTTVADHKDIGSIVFNAANSAGADETYAQILVEVQDVTDGTEDSDIRFNLYSAGTFVEALSMSGEGGFIFNEGGADMNFRIESVGTANAFALDAGNNRLNINTSETSFEVLIRNTNGIALEVNDTGVVINEGSDDIDFRIETDGVPYMLYVDAAEDRVIVGDDANNTLQKGGFAVVNDFSAGAFMDAFSAGEFGSAEILRFSPGANDTLTAGQLYFFHTDGTWDSTDADAVATGATQLLGIGLGGSARAVGCLTRGFIRIAATEVLNIPTNERGLPLYVSTTAGHLDFTPPSGNGDFVRIVGYCIGQDGTGGTTDVWIYFNPDATHVEITA